MKLVNRSFVALCAMALSAASFAWNDTGHMLIAAIAEGRLNPKVWDECIRLSKIGGTDTTKGFIQGSTWADDTKTPETAPWHYINLPLRIDGKQPKTKPAEQNVVWAINHFSEILKDKTKPDAERADALRYLTNLVGDVHQPMHAVTMESDEHPDGDRNGLDYPVKGGDLFKQFTNPPTNLHDLWEMGVSIFPPDMEKRPLGPDGEGRTRMLGQTLTARIPIAMFQDQVKDLDPMHWAQESFNTARDTAYKVRTGGEIDLGYFGVGKTIATSRATLAGYRLAALLNSLLKAPGKS